MHIPFIILLLSGLNCLFIVIPPIIQWCKYMLQDRDTFLNKITPLRLMLYSFMGGILFVLFDCVILTTLFFKSNITSVLICLLMQLILIATLPALPKICYAIGSISLASMKAFAKIAVLCFDYLLSGLVIIATAPCIIVYWLYIFWHDREKTTTK